MAADYCKRMSAHPQHAELGRDRLREKVERRANRSVHGDFRITWRFDRRVDDESASEPVGESTTAPLPHLRNVR